MADYSRAIDLEPDEPRYYLSRARCLLEHLGNPHDAGVDIETAIGLADPARDPAVLDALVLKARTLLAEGKVVQATRALAEFVKDAGAAVAMADWDPVGRGILDDGTVVDGPVVLEAIEEAVELLEAIPEDEELRMLDRLLRNLAGRL
jgi:hypothetical protein